jgi:hypothetical protein
MKIVTANALRDGGVVYYRAPGQWVRAIADATLLDEAALQAALDFAVGDQTAIVAPYAMAVSAPGTPDARVKTRETIRANGPTIPVGQI